MKTNRIITILAAAMLILSTAGCTSSPSASSGKAMPQPATTEEVAAVSTPIQPDTTGVHWPVLRESKVADTAEIEAIKNTIKQAARIESDVYWSETYDMSRFPAVFVGEPNVPLSRGQQEFLNQVRLQQNDVSKELLQGNGFLASARAGVLNAKKANENWDRILTRAKAEGREPTQDELQSVDEGVVGGAGSPRDMIKREPYQEPPFDFKAFKIQGNQADITYDDGAALRRAFLIKTSEGWKIAGRVVLNAHY